MIVAELLDKMGNCEPVIVRRTYCYVDRDCETVEYCNFEADGEDEFYSNLKKVENEEIAYFYVTYDGHLVIELTH